MNALRRRSSLTIGVAVLMLVSSIGLLGALGGTAPSTPSSFGPATPEPTSVRPSSPGPSAPISSPCPASSLSSSESPAVARAFASGIDSKYLYIPGPAASVCQEREAVEAGHVTPQYNATPAPMGIAEYGLRSTAEGALEPFSLNTTSVQGTFDTPSSGAPNATDLLSVAPDTYGVQLNAVTTNVTLFGVDGYQFWTQDVMDYSPYTHSMFFITNIWNWSNTLGLLGPSDFYSHGPHGSFSGGSLYYADVGPFTVSYPFNLTLTMANTVVDGRDAVYFSANVTSSSGDIALPDYDYAVFNSLSPDGQPLTAPSSYTADGGAYNLIGHTNDFELVLGGPGGGTQATLLSANATETLNYWNASANRYTAVPSAYSFGSETGETATGANIAWATASDGQPYAVVSTGPSLLGGLWNASAPAGGPGTLNVLVQPSNAFVVLEYGASSPFNISTPEWVPTVTTHVFTLAAGTYSIAFLASDYAPQYVVNFTIAAGAPTTLQANLARDPSLGIYAPLWAWTNAQIANLSVSGDGTSSSPYVITNDQPAPLIAGFALFNDQDYLAFPGVYFIGTTAYTNFVQPAEMAAYISTTSTTTVDMPWWFYDDSHVAITGATNISGWFPQTLGTSNSYNVVAWNCTNFLIANDSFQTEAHALLLYGGTDNFVWGNTFSQIDAPFSASFLIPFSEGIGLSEEESGDAIYNNLFASNPTTAVSPSTDMYSGGPITYTDAWNITPQGASQVHYAPAWPDYPLSGSIVGGAIQGGNFWWDYGMVTSQWFLSNPYGVLPYTEAGRITNGGDDAPLLYTPLYQIELVPTGLPSSASWGYSVNGVSSNEYDEFAYGLESPRASALVNLTGAPVATYIVLAYTSLANYSDRAVRFTVTENASVDLSFVATYQVSFAETGLPSGSSWSVSINGTSHSARTGSKLEADLRNGTYPYVLQDYPGYTQGTLPYSGTFVIAGASVEEPTLLFTLTTFSITFNETGLPAGSWSVVVNGTTYSEPVGSPISAALPNGTYPYLVPDYAGYHQSVSPYSGTVTLDGFAVVRPTLVFQQVTYPIAFSQSGLPNGALWTVTVGTATFSSATSELIIEAPNGTYAYVANPSGPYVPQSAGSGTFTVQGSPVSNVATVYAYTVVLSFSESGLPTGSSWSVNVSAPSGAHWQNSSSSSAITFRLLANTTYVYRIAVPSGYTVSPASGTVPLAGSGQMVPTVSIAPTSGSSATPWYDALWLWVAVGAVIVVAGIAVALLRSRGRPRN